MKKNLVKRFNCILLILLVLLLGIGGAGNAKQALWTGVDRIVAVGDVHGDYGQFIKVLKAADLIDEDNQWIGGKTHLVQVGDVLDRGRESRKVLDLLMSLEKQAEEAMGHVHALIGNHEAMVMLGDLRYVHPDDFKAFGGKRAYLKAMLPTGKYGRWIASNNTVIIINDVMFLHGGMSPGINKFSLAAINEGVRDELQNLKVNNKSFVVRQDGPLWYRGQANDREVLVSYFLDQARKHYNFNHLVIGHSAAGEGIRMRGKGKVIMIDVGISRCYGGPAECLVIEKGKYYRVTSDKKQRFYPYAAKLANPGNR